MYYFSNPPFRVLPILINSSSESNSLFFLVFVVFFLSSFFIFPSNLFHCPDKNVSSIIRHSLAINILPVGKIGVSDSELIMK